MEKSFFEKPVYTTEKDVYGWRIDKNILEDRVIESADLITSPRGLSTKLFVDGCELRSWEYDGHSSLIDTFDSEEDAELEWLSRIYEHDYMNSDNCLNDYDSELDALCAIANSLGLSEIEIQRMVIDGKEKADTEAKEIADHVMSVFYYEKEKSDKCGTITKAFRSAIYKARDHYYAGGYSFPTNGGRLLPVDNFYTKDFKEDLANAISSLIG